jgi:hypothetical protein
MTPKTRITVISLLLVTAAHGATSSTRTAKTYSVVAQKSTHRGIEQLALILREADAELITNSNFLSLSDKAARLGRFTSPLNTRLGTRMLEIKNAVVRLGQKAHPGDSDSSKGGDPHRVRYFLDGTEVAPNTEEQRLVIEILSSAWRLADWQGTSTATISLSRDTSKSGELQVSYGDGRPPLNLSQKKVGCRPISENTVRCEIPQFGTAYLQR